MRSRWGLLPLATVILVSWQLTQTVGREHTPAHAVARPVRLPAQRVPPVMPAEFEPVESLMVSWDPELRGVYANIAAAIEGEAPLIFLVRPDEQVDVRDMFEEYGLDAGNLRFVDVDTDTVWIRDYAPFRMRGTRGRWVVEFDYEERPGDDAAAKVISESLWPQERVLSAPLRLDGGNILSNGAGVCVSTEQIYELDSRYTRFAVRRLLRTFLGCQKLVVLPQLAGEPTGHVDMYVALTSRDHAIVGQFDPADDEENAVATNLAATRLERAGFRVDRVRMPPNSDGRFRSHTNALAVNGVVLVPTYDEEPELEAQVLEVFARAYPDRRIIPIDATELIELDGAVHCVAITIAR